MSAKVVKRKRFQIENGFPQRRRSPRIQAYNEAKKVNLSNRQGTKKPDLVKCEHLKKKKKKESVPPNQIRKGTCFSKKANLVKCQHQGKKKKKKKSVPPNQIRKGKRQIDVDEQATGIYLQEHIIVEILSRLPVRSLLRFKCVSRIWEALISHPYFKTKKHQQSRHDSKLLIRNCCFTQDRRIEFHFHSSSLSTFEDVQQLDSPLSYKVDHYEIFSSLDGLVLLRADTQLLLWNPSTRESALVLPQSEYNILTAYGLGYDATGDCYKILKLDMRRRQLFEILTLKSASWRKICDYPAAVCPTTGYKMEINAYPSRIMPMDPLVYVHGAFHWPGHLGMWGNIYAVSFSISDEVFGDVPLLEEMSTGVSQWCDIGLTLLDGMLCFHGISGTFKLWAMKDYGVKESWILLFTLQLNGLFIAKPRYRFPDGDVLLYAPGVLPRQCRVPMSYIFQTSKGRFGFWPRRSFEKGIVYRESLISPKSVI